MKSGYLEVPHTADIALEVWAGDLGELFVQAALGLFSLAAAVEPGAPPTACRQIELSAPDWEALLVDWLNELLWQRDEHHEAYVAFEVTLPEYGRLVARAQATQAYEHRKTVKAATFHDLAIHQADKGYRATIVFDV